MGYDSAGCRADGMVLDILVVRDIVYRVGRLRYFVGLVPNIDAKFGIGDAAL